MRCAHRRADAIGKVAQALTQCYHTYTFTLATPMQQVVKLGAQLLAHRGRDTNELVRQLVKRMTQAKSQACSWKQGPHTADRTVKAVGERPLYPVRGLMRKGRLLELAIGRGERRGTFGVAVPQMPDDPATDDGGQIDPVGETGAVFLIGQDRRWVRQATFDQDRDQAVLPQGTDQTIEGPGGDMANGCRPFQAEAAMGGDQGLAGHIRAHASIAEDEVRQDREHRPAGGALNTPDSEAAQANAGIMGVAGQTSAAGTGRPVDKLEAEREEEGEDKLDKRFAIVDQLEVGGWVLEIDGDGAVLACRFGGVAHGHLHLSGIIKGCMTMKTTD